MQTQSWIKLSRWWIKKKQNAINEIEYYQEIEYKNNRKVFQNIVATFKINSIDFSFILFLYVRLLGFVVVAYLFHVQL